MIQTRLAVLRHPLATVGGLVALGLVAVASLAFAAKPESPTSDPRLGETKCESASLPASDSELRALRRSVRCLINEERAIHGFGKLDRHAALQLASQRHVKAMVETACLAHRCPDEPDLETRLERAGYFDGAESWRYAENTGCGVSAEAMVENWMDTVYHRVNILDEDFHDVGVGVSLKRVAGRCQKDYATFAVVFGERKP
jgi:uncharacterized protein YkwD